MKILPEFIATRYPEPLSHPVNALTTLVFLVLKASLSHSQDHLEKKESEWSLNSSRHFNKNLFSSPKFRPLIDNQTYKIPGLTKTAEKLVYVLQLERKNTSGMSGMVTFATLKSE